MKNLFNYKPPKYRFILILALISLTLPAVAQFYFGRNKVNYENFNWRVLKSDNFDIYYYQDEENIAALARNIAEKAYREYEIKFNVTIDRKIPLVIYSNPLHFQQTNIIPNILPEGVGGFFEYMKGRVVLPFNGNREDFHHVVRHEIVHVFTHYKINTTARRIGYFERSGFPLWFIEGLAEYWSIGYGKEAEMYIKDAILHDYLIPINSFELYFTGYLLYKEGQAFMKYYEDNYGADRIRKLMTEYWKYESFEEAISNISGVPLRQIIKEWILYLKKKYAGNLQQENIMNIDTRKINNRDIQVNPAIYAQDSVKKMIYMSNKWGYENIIMKDLTTSAEEILIRGQRTPKYESLHLLRSNISVNNQGELAFVAKSGGSDIIWIYDIHKREQLSNIASEDLFTISSPSWSKNGKMLAFTAQDSNGWSDLYLWKRSNNKILRLTTDIYDDTSPCFSPDNQYLVFSSDRHSQNNYGSKNIYLYKIESGNIFRITRSGSNQIKPRWDSNHTNQIFYLSDSTGTYNLWSAILDDPIFAQGGKLQHQQLSDFYTGIHTYSPLDKDRLLISNFSNYNYHLSKHSFDSIKTTYYDTVSAYQKVEKPKERLKLEEQEIKAYKMKYSLDLAQTAVAYDPIFGMLGGAQLSISDMLGNRYYNFLLANTSRTSSEIMEYWNVAATMIDLRKRADRSVSLFHFANDYYSPYEGFYFERTIGTRGALNYPIHKYDRLELSTSLWHSTKDYYGDQEKRFLMSNFISYVHDNSMWIMTGPIDGWRMRLTAGPSFNFKSSEISNYTFLGDFRYYWRIHRNITFAHRTMSIFNGGDDVRRFYIGGSWFMRGYNYTEVYGRKFILFNNELRLPLAQSLTLNFGKSKIGFFPVRSAVFVDIGNAWDYDFPGFIGSFGIGIRGALMGQLVLRLDIGKRTDFKSVQKELFVKFFFGWNY